MTGAYKYFDKRSCTWAVALASTWLAACGSLDDKSQGPEPRDKREQPMFLGGHIVVTERAVGGGRLVVVAENGDRVDELTRIGPVRVRDSGATWSPDGRWIAFASSRARTELMLTSLWIVEARPNAEPRRLTVQADAVDSFPVFAPDGQAIVFASSRGHGFDLYRLALRVNARGIPVAASLPEPITSGPDDDFHPTFAPDGERLAFTRLAADGSGSRIMVLDVASGALRAATDGPFDATPRWSPDGQWIAFAGLSTDQPSGQASAEKDAGGAAAVDGDADLFLVRPDGTERQLVLRESRADQTGPVWSADGRYLFCTSVFRLGGEPVLSSVTFVALGARPRVMRALHERIAVVSRMDPALDSAALDTVELDNNLEYAEALDRALEAQILREQ